MKEVVHCVVVLFEVDRLVDLDVCHVVVVDARVNCDVLKVVVVE